MLFKEIRALFQKELTLEWRQRYALNGILLYVVSSIFICYLSFNLRRGQLDPITWNALFWIIMLFSAVNAVAKSFMQERYGQVIYYYTLASPEGIILAKILYNALLMLLLAFLGYAFYTLVLGNPIQDHGLFIAVLVLGALGFSGTLTMVSGIAAKAGNSATLMAVLGFPIVIPMLLMIIRVSKNAIDGLERAVSINSLLVLLAMNVIVITLSYMLFPYLWRT